MKTKTAELTGPALDWAVRQCLNPGFKDYVPARDNFSTCWNKGGPIIESHGICLLPWGLKNWSAHCSHGPTAARRVDGPTPLIAAMRCYVTSKLGDEVDVPDELLQS